MPTDDYAGGTETGGTIAPGTSATGTLEAPQDRDWFAVSLVAGQRYQFLLVGSGANPLDDPLLRLHDGTGTVLLGEDDDGGPGFDSLLDFVAGATGTFYLDAGAYVDAEGVSSIGSYTLSAAAVTAGADGGAALSGTAGIDALVGGAGSDALAGLAGDDILTGGDGADRFEVGEGLDLVTDFGVGDELHLQAVLAGSTVAAGDASTVTGFGVASQVVGGTTWLWMDLDGEAGAETGVRLGRVYQPGDFSVATNGSASRIMLDGDPYANPGDDHGEDAGSATAFTLGGSATGTIEVPGDTDWFAVELQAGQSYRFSLAGSPPGYDVLLAVRDSGGNVIAEDDDGGDGTSASLVLEAPADGTYYLAAAGYEYLTGPYVLSGRAIHQLVGTDGDDDLAGGGGNDEILAGAGDDWLEGRQGDDLLQGGEGNDWADYFRAAAGVVVDLALHRGEGEGHDTLDGIENVWGSRHDDTLAGDGMHNLLAGDGGNDLLEGRQGDDELSGGSGDDTLDGGLGIDTARYLRHGQAMEIDLGAGFASGSGEHDTLVDLEDAIGTAFDDVVRGSDQDNDLWGSTGDDTLVGRDGDDTLDGEAGADSMEGGAGDDEYWVDRGADVVVEARGGGWDIIFSDTGMALPDNVEGLRFIGRTDDVGDGNAMNNLLHGGQGADRLQGLDGDDKLIGGGGDDTLIGGAGDDKLFGRGGDDSMVGGTGGDWYRVLSAGDVVIELAGEGSDLVDAWMDYALGANVEDLYLKGDALSGTGNALNNYVSGTIGDNDLRGLGGHDTLRGGEGDDRLDGGAGHDKLVGDAGADTYVFASGSGDDGVFRFSQADGDRLEIEAGINGSGIATADDVLAMASQVGHHTVLDLGGGQSVTLVGVALADLAAEAIVVV